MSEFVETLCCQLYACAWITALVFSWSDWGVIALAALTIAPFLLLAGRP